MAKAVLRTLPVASGILVSDRSPIAVPTNRIRWFRGSHPLPGQGSLAAGKAALRLVDGLGPGGLL